MLLPFLSIFIIVTLYISIRIRNSKRAEEDIWDDFWTKEQEANWTRRQDISDLPYIHVPLDALPLGKFDAEALNGFEDRLRELTAQPICNLNGISNTDLKLRYGAANLPALSECDTNYSTLLSLLANYGEKLYELSHRDEAKQVLEYALSLKTDVGKTYELLAAIYEEEGRPGQLDALRAAANELVSIRKNSILRKLDARKEQDTPT